MADVLGGYGIVTPLTVLPTGIDLREFTGGIGAAFRELHAIPANHLTLVTVGRLAIERNIDFLLQVVQRLTEDFPELLLLIAGDGPDASRLKKLSVSMGLKDKVCLVGNLDRRTTLLDCYRAGDIFVFASPSETQGLVLTEAMALAVPIVSTAVTGTADVLRDAHSACVSEARWTFSLPTLHDCCARQPSGQDFPARGQSMPKPGVQTF